MTDSRDEIARIRAVIDQADADLVTALNARATAVNDYAKLRAREPERYHALATNAEAVARAREQLREFPAESFEPVMREVLSACNHMLAPVSVAAPGSRGGFAHFAARQWFGEQARIDLWPSVAEVFAEVERGRVGNAIVPFDTSTDGVLSETLACLVETRAKVNGDIVVPHRLNLYSRDLETPLTAILGDAGALASARRTLTVEHPDAEHIEEIDADRIVARVGDSASVGVIGSESVTDMLPGLQLRRREVADRAGASTRYIVLGQSQPRRTGQDTTLLVVAIEEKAGALYAALQPIAERGINLSRLESRPLNGVFRKNFFFAELDGHTSDRNVIAAMDELRSRARFVKVLGSFPRGQGD